LDEEDRLGSFPSVEVLGDELDLAFSGRDSEGGVGVATSGDHLFGTLSNIGWACDEEFDVLVFVGSVGPSADNRVVSSSTSNVSDSVEFVDGGGDGSEGRGWGLLSVASGGGDFNLVRGSWLETDEGISWGSDVGDGDKLSIGGLVSKLEVGIVVASWDIPDDTSDSLLGLAKVADVGNCGEWLGGSGWGDGVGWDGSAGW